MTRDDQPTTVEMPAIRLPRVDDKCGWCGLSLSAVPDPPKPYVRVGHTVIGYYHPLGCISAQRNEDAGISDPLR